MRIRIEFIKIGIIFLLLCSLFDVKEYGNQLLSAMVVVGFCILSFNKDKKNKNSKAELLFWGAGIVLMLIPFIKFTLAKGVYGPIVGALVLCLIYSIYVSVRKKKQKIETAYESGSMEYLFQELLQSGFIEKDDCDMKKCVSFLYKRIYIHDDAELIDFYNREYSLGETKDSMQYLYIVILHHIFMQRYKDSPIVLLGNHRFMFKGIASLEDKRLVITEDPMTYHY